MATVAPMRIAVLGPLEVTTDDGGPVALAGAKERLLLAVLATSCPEVVSADALADALWDGDLPSSARKSLQAHVVRLRTALEPGRPAGSTGRYVLRRGTGYALAVGRADLDALLIADRAARGHALLAAGDVDRAEQDLASALGLWHGEPYADWPDAPFAEPERRRLQEVHAGALAGLLEARLREGRHAEVLPQLERLVAEDPLREDWWRLLLLGLYRAGRQADALSAARRVRAVLADELGAEPGPALRAMEAAILAQDPALELPQRSAAPAVVPPVRAATCPYKGLAAYQAADAPMFHGRGRLVSALVAALVDAPVVVVSGPSGAGKSSAVRAGLVPALAGGALPGSGAWRPVLVTPGSRPVDALALLTGDELPDEPVVLVCDQFEEAWGPEVEPAERTAFLDALLGLVDDGVVVRCVLVVRGDHVGRLAEHAPLAERVGGALVLVPPMTDGELREVVGSPAAAVGLSVEPALLDAVAADGLGHPGALPLLSAALVSTWERRSGDVLTLAGYLQSGGVAGALARTAERVFAALDDEGRRTARRLLVRLADVDDGGALVRRAVPLAELDLTGNGGAQRRGVIEAFVGRRLLSVDAGRLEVAHEALFSAWPRLAGWLSDDAAGRAVRRHLAPAAHEWAAADRPDDELYRGARLAAALDWASSPDAAPTPIEEDFLAASHARADAELAAARGRADREATGRRRTRRLAAGLAAVLVVALVATGVALRSAQDAQRASLRADAHRLATLATGSGSTDLSLLLGVQALRLADVPETRTALLGALVERGRAQRVVTLPQPVRSVAVLSDGTVLSDPRDGGVLAWTPTTAAAHRLPGDDANWADSSAGWDVDPARDLLAGGGATGAGRPWLGVRSPSGEVLMLAIGAEVGGYPLALSFTDDGSRLVVLEGNGTGFGNVTPGADTWGLAVFDVSDGSRRALAASGTLTSADGVLADVSDDAATAVVADAGSEVVTLVDVRSAAQVVLRSPARRAETVGVRAIPSGAVQLWSDGAVTLFGRDGRVRQELNAARGPVADVVVAPDGTWAATAGAGGEIALWDVDPVSGGWTAREQLVGHDGDVLDAAVDPSGSRLVTVGADARVVVWDATGRGGFGATLRPVPDRSVAGPPQVVDPGRLVVLPTQPDGAGPSARQRRDRAGGGAGEGLPVFATFVRPGTGEVVADIPVGSAPAAAREQPTASVSPDRRLVAVSNGAVVSVFDAGSRRLLSRYTPAPFGVETGRPTASAVGCLGWGSSPTRLLVCTDEEDFAYGLTVVDPRTGARVGTAPLGVAAQAVATSADGGTLAVAAFTFPDEALLLVDARTLAVRRFVGLPTAFAPTHASFSRDGRIVAVTTGDGLAVVDTRTGQLSRAPAPLTGAVRQAEWFTDDRTLAVVGPGRAVYLYDVRSRQVSSVQVPPTGDGGRRGLRLVPGMPEELVVIGGDGGGRRYPLDPDTWMARACAVVGRDLTAQEWARYVPDRPYRATCSDLG
jgi:DNA-binding SARP family transcriptional activator/WD40 repeat protein